MAAGDYKGGFTTASGAPASLPGGGAAREGSTVGADAVRELGFVNVSQSCFLNAVLQCVLRVPDPAGVGLHPFVRQALENRIAAGPVSREVATLARRLHVDTAVSDGVLTHRAPVCSAALRHVLAAEATRAASGHMGAGTIHATGPGDAADAAEALISAMCQEQQQLPAAQQWQIPVQCRWLAVPDQPTKLIHVTLQRLSPCSLPYR